MKNLTYSALLLLIFSIPSFGQITFEKGYFIDKNNQRTACLIKNQDWKNNPKSFSYKIVNEGSVVEGNITNVHEFGFDNGTKFKAFEVAIDRSPDHLRGLTPTRNPTFQQEQLFLKSIVEGNASLYSYEGENLIRFFYSIDTGSVEQLVYKKYLISDTKVAYNNAFRQQLINNVSCLKDSRLSAEGLGYHEASLKRYFLKYNACIGSTPTFFEEEEERDVFNLKITPGVNSSGIYLHSSAGVADDIDFGQKIIFRFGLEAEYILPFNKNKWSMIIEPTFKSFNAKGRFSSQDIIFKHSFIDIPIGVRYRIFFKNGEKLYFNGFYNSNVALNSSGISPAFPDGTDLKIINLSSFAFGGGVEFGITSIEIRSYSNRNLFAADQVWNASSRGLSFILGFKLVKTKSKPFKL